MLAATESTDGYTGTTPEQLAELLGLPSVTFAKKIEVADGTAKVQRQTEAGYDVVIVRFMPDGSLDFLAGQVVGKLWAVLIAIGFLAFVWILYLILMSARPQWLQSLFGPGVSWEYVQNVGFWAISIFKMCIWLLALVVVWLTLWARQLGKRTG